MKKRYRAVVTQLFSATVNPSRNEEQTLSAEWVIIPVLLLGFSAAEWLQLLNPVNASPLVVTAMATAATACSLFKYWMNRGEGHAI